MIAFAKARLGGREPKSSPSTGMRRMRAHSFIILAGILTAVPGGLSAHHSFAASFEGSRKITLAGVVTKVEWENPHTYFYLSVKTEQGKVANWICQAAGPNTLARHGWARDLIRVGDMVTVIGYPARGGSPVASAREVILNDGRKMFAGSAYDGAPER